MKKILFSSIAAGVLLLSGCGESDGEAELQLQQSLDEGNYAYVIDVLESATTKTSSDYMLLAAAYMGQAGLALPDLIKIVDESTNDSGDGFASLINSVGDSISSTALNDLKKSSEYYNNVVSDCTDANLSYTQQDVCIYKGLVSTLKAATTVNYIAEDVSVLVDNTGAIDPKLTASACAMQYAYDGTIGTDCSIVDNNVTRTYANTITYNVIAVTELNDNTTFEFLLKDNDLNITQTVVTDGYCTVDSFSPRLDANSTDLNASFYVCPVNESNVTSEELTTEELLVDTLNQLTTDMSVVDTEDVKDSINEFKCDVLGGTYDADTNNCTVSLDTNVTTDDVVNYLNTNN